MRIDDARFVYDLNPDVAYRLIEIEDDRYSGCYSGGAFTAWPGVRPDHIDAGDLTCEEFWRTHANVLHGKGATPQAAFEDLVAKIGEQWDVASALQFVSVCGQPYLFDSNAFRAWLGTMTDMTPFQRALAAGDPVAQRRADEMRAEHLVITESGDYPFGIGDGFACDVDDGRQLLLDGTFTLDQLERLVAWMRSR